MGVLKVLNRLITWDFKTEIRFLPGRAVRALEIFLGAFYMYKFKIRFTVLPLNMYHSKYVPILEFGRERRWR